MFTPKKADAMSPEDQALIKAQLQGIPEATKKITEYFFNVVDSDAAAQLPAESKVEKVSSQYFEKHNQPLNLSGDVFFNTNVSESSLRSNRTRFVQLLTHELLMKPEESVMAALQSVVKQSQDHVNPAYKSIINRRITDEAIHKVGTMLSFECGDAVNTLQTIGKVFKADHEELQAHFYEQAFVAVSNATGPFLRGDFGKA